MKKNFEFKELTLEFSSNNLDVLEEKNYLFFLSKTYSAVPLQGWKIHISSTLANSKKIFFEVYKYCSNNNISFKVIKNYNLLKHINNKDYSRSQAGKFITLYPTDNEEFIKVTKDLNKKIGFLHGPYILSDKRLKGSKNIFYRYGRMRTLKSEVEEDKLSMTLPNGHKVKDERKPYYINYDCVEDPLSDSEDTLNDNGDSYLTNNYQIEKLLHTSARGGIYEGKNKSNNPIIIKEIRPFILSGTDKTWEENLENEISNLKRWSRYDFAPNYIDHFTEWEHHFIVMSKIEGYSLAKIKSDLSNAYINIEERNELYQRVDNIVKQIIEIVKTLHNFDYVIGDISINNFIINNDDQVFMVDFENVRKVYDSDGLSIGTYGFYPKKGMGNIGLKRADMYSLGLLIVNLFVNSNYLIDIQEKLFKKNFEVACKNLRIPNYIKTLILTLLDIERDISPEHLLSFLKEKNEIQYIIGVELSNLNLDNSFIIDEEYIRDLVNISTDKFHEYEYIKLLEDLKLSLESGAIGYLLKSINNKSINKKELVTSIIKLLEKIRMNNKKGEWFIIDSFGGLNPYLLNGTAGLIYLFQKIRSKEEYKEIFYRFQEEYREILESINVTFANRCDFRNGLTGIAFVLIEEETYLKEKKYNIESILETIISYSFVDLKKVNYADYYSERFSNTQVKEIGYVYNIYLANQEK